MIASIVALFAVIVVAAFIVFRQRAKVEIKGPGKTGLKLDASNSVSQQAAWAQQQTARAGIFGGLNIGKNRREVRGSGVIEKTTNIGGNEEIVDTTTVPTAQPEAGPRAKRK
jgi:hypothetical protein